jgi:hypothetical protein
VNTGERLIGAINEISPAARSAKAAVSSQKTDADPLAHLPTSNAFADNVDSSDDFVARHAREGDAGNEPIYGV